MEDDSHFEATAAACLKAHGAVADVGTPAMFAMSRALLYQIGQELVQREECRKKMLCYDEAHRPKLRS